MNRGGTGGQQDVWLVPNSGGQPVRVTNDAGTEEDLTWARDGKSVTFSYTEAVQQLFIQPADSGPARQLTSGSKGSSDPQVSPDGRSIAYTSDQAGSQDIWIVPTVGGELRRLTTSQAHDNSAFWSPDGKRIAYLSNQGGDQNVWIVPAEGGEPTQLTSLAGDESGPLVWSPDGKTITFASAFEASNSDLWSVPAAGGAPSRLTHSGNAGNPAWSPDGRTLLFSDGKMGCSKSSALRWGPPYRSSSRGSDTQETLVSLPMAGASSSVHMPGARATASTSCS